MIVQPKRVFPAFAFALSVTAAESPARQGDTPFDVLSVPARNVGTCVPLPGVDSTRRTSRLVIKSTPPGNTREVTVTTDQSGHASTYTDQVLVMRSPLAGVGRSVIAVLPQGGAVTGFLQETGTSYPSIPTDVAALRALRDSAQSNVSRRSLTEAELRKLPEVIVFLRRRCPA